jgi:hypothetical protein
VPARRAKVACRCANPGWQCAARPPLTYTGVPVRVSLVDVPSATQSVLLDVRQRPKFQDSTSNLVCVEFLCHTFNQVAPCRCSVKAASLQGVLPGVASASA